MNILVLAGGLSPERNVSLSSGSLIASALKSKGHRVAMLDVYEGIELTDGSSPLDLFTDRDEYIFKVGNDAPTPEELEKIADKNGGRRELIGPNVLSVAKAADVVFLALHGDMGENGQLQAALDVFDITYTGSGYIGSLLAMNKDIAKKLLSAEGIATPHGVKYDVGKDMDSAVLRCLPLGFPLVVKPCSCGSSVGVSVVENEHQLRDALAVAAEYESCVLIEQRIIGRELTQGILAGEVLPPVEIIPKVGFYDYKNKYLAGATDELCPAPLTDAELAKISEATARGFSALCLGDYARFDYILDKDGVFWCLEANTLPGMTPTSLLPQEAAAIGIDYASLCEKLALTALNKKKKKK